MIPSPYLVVYNHVLKAVVVGSVLHLAVLCIIVTHTRPRFVSTRSFR